MCGLGKRHCGVIYKVYNRVGFYPLKGAYRVCTKWEGLCESPLKFIIDASRAYGSNRSRDHAPIRFLGFYDATTCFRADASISHLNVCDRRHNQLPLSGFTNSLLRPILISASYRSSPCLFHHAVQVSFMSIR